MAAQAGAAMTARSAIRWFFIFSAVWVGVGIGCLFARLYFSAFPCFAAALGCFDGAMLRASYLRLVQRPAWPPPPPPPPEES
jgi:hypothetical protein